MSAKHRRWLGAVLLVTGLGLWGAITPMPEKYPDVPISIASDCLVDVASSPVRVRLAGIAVSECAALLEFAREHHWTTGEVRAGSCTLAGSSWHCPKPDAFRLTRVGLASLPPIHEGGTGLETEAVLTRDERLPEIFQVAAVKAGLAEPVDCESRSALMSRLCSARDRRDAERNHPDPQ